MTTSIPQGGRARLTGGESLDGVPTPPGPAFLLHWNPDVARAVFAHVVGQGSWTPPNELVGRAMADIQLQLAYHDWDQSACSHEGCADEHGHSDGCFEERAEQDG